jgi:cytochrome c5
MKKLAAAALMLMSNFALADRPVEELYPKTCGVCHAAAVAGAPKSHDEASWKPRFDAKGMDGLLQSVHNGLNAMPPKGMCMDCTDGEYKALIEFMMKPAA